MSKRAADPESNIEKEAPLAKHARLEEEEDDTPLPGPAHPLDSVRDPATGAPTQLAVLLAYVRDSGKYNMFFEYRDACEAAMAVGALLGQELDVDSWLNVPLKFWWSMALEDKQYATVVAATACGLPGGEEYREMMKARGGSPRTQLDSKAIIAEALEEAGRWAVTIGHDKTDIIAGAQLLAFVGKLAPRDGEEAKLADSFL